ncbi:hypothetical protein VTO42DRAFT_5420 [Malbranchea cinnamomea]
MTQWIISPAFFFFQVVTLEIDRSSLLKHNQIKLWIKPGAPVKPQDRNRLRHMTWSDVSFVYLIPSSTIDFETPHQSEGAGSRVHMTVFGISSERTMTGALSCSLGYQERFCVQALPRPSSVRRVLLGGCDVPCLTCRLMEVDPATVDPAASMAVNSSVYHGVPFDDS